MPALTRVLALSTATLALGAGAALAQLQTPLSGPATVSGSVSTTQSSGCGNRHPAPVQTLQVNQDFAAVEVTISGTSGITLLIEGNNGFSECHTSSSGTIVAPGLLNRGTYSFYVGNSQAPTTSYVLEVK